MNGARARGLAARRVGGAAAVAALLALNLACPDDDSGPPDMSLCDGAPASADIAGFEAQITDTVGGQGTPMIAVDARWLGASAPECARLSITAVGRRSGTYDETFDLETEEISGGRAARTTAYVIVDTDCYDVTVESYGVEVHAEVDTSFSDDGCDEVEDAGADGGGADAAAEDGGPTDAAVEDAG